MLIPLMLGSAALGLIGQGVSAGISAKNSKEARKYAERQELKNAIARALGMDVVPMSKQPQPKSTFPGDVMSGLGQLGTSFASSEYAKRMFPAGPGSIPQPRAFTPDWRSSIG